MVSLVVNTPNNAPTVRHDSFILHFVDVLICHMAKIESKPSPTVTIPSSSFNEVPTGMIDSDFMNIYGDDKVAFSDEEKWFVEKNADIYYHIYGYWHNYSNKPICLSCDNIAGMRRSKQLQNNDIHVRHQDAKFNELKRKSQGDHVRGLYLVD